MSNLKRKSVACVLLAAMLIGILPVEWIHAKVPTEEAWVNEVAEVAEEARVRKVAEEDQVREAAEVPEEEQVREIAEESEGARVREVQEEPEEMLQEQVAAEFAMDGGHMAAVGKEMVMNISDMEESTISSPVNAGNDGFYTIHARAGSDVKITQNSKSIDGFNFTKRLQFQGTGNESYRSISFTVSGGAAVIVYAISGSSAERPLTLYQTDSGLVMGSQIVDGNIKKLEYKITEAGTYNLRSDMSGINLYYISVLEEGGGEVVKKPWDEVEPPTISSIIQEDTKIVVSYQLVTGDEGADSGIALMMSEDGTEELARQVIGKNPSSERTAEFTPNGSGIYRFLILALRSGEADKESEAKSCTYLLPLAVPIITNLENKGSGEVLVSWNEIKEVEIYEIAHKKTGDATFTNVGQTNELRMLITGLEVGVSYTIQLSVIRGSERRETTAEITTSDEAQKTWTFAAFGPSTNKTDNGYAENADGSISVWSKNGRGKFCQPIEPDGLAFYYTVIDAEHENFVLSANIKVNSWKNSGGQDAFGLLAADNVGIDGESAPIFNNMVAAFCSKVEYLWDSEKNKVSNTGTKITMKAGIGALEKTGALPNSHPITGNLKPLELSCANLEEGGGTYNIIGNYEEDPGNTKNHLTEFKFTIKRNNTGYYCTYYEADGVTVIGEEIFYDIDRTKLCSVDKDNIYVGFFAARNADITVTDMELNISDPHTDPPAEDRNMEEVEPDYQVISQKATGIRDYDFMFKANADGKLSVITKWDGKEIIHEQDIEADIIFTKHLPLHGSNNIFKVTFRPDRDYKPSEYEVLSDYEPRIFEHSVSYKTYGRIGEAIYVSPNGSADGTGSIDKPLDIYTAVDYVRPGQMILLAGGTYHLSKTIRIERGNHGTPQQMIYMIADNNVSTRPVFDFGYECAGMVIGADYWYLKGFDVTHSKNALKGIQVSGNNCVYDQLNTYYNGNTGLQISRLNAFDSISYWPSNNLILNCTSYGNADSGYEDADGFAAKLTVREGNIFRGCIAYNNADDGWDLFAKVETGIISKVVIDNCVAFNNGFLEDGTNAGNGNGFKMGGSNLSGQHEIMNSIAYDNKAKGIDSNSCPDIQAVRSTAFNNSSYNIAFYTNIDINTDFFADGIISYKTAAGMNDSDNISLKGMQDRNKIYKPSCYYRAGGKSVNTEGIEVSEDWFVSLDTSRKPVRDADGSIQMNGLLELTEKAPADVGARLIPTPSQDITPFTVIKDRLDPAQDTSYMSEGEQQEHHTSNLVEVVPELKLPAISHNDKKDSVEIEINIPAERVIDSKNAEISLSSELPEDKLNIYLKDLPSHIKHVKFSIYIPEKTNEGKKINVKRLWVASSILEMIESKNSNITFYMKQKNIPAYSWYFSAKALLSSLSKGIDLNLAASVSEIHSKEGDKLNELLREDGKNVKGNYVNGLLVTFYHSGLLPAEAEVKVYGAGNPDITGIGYLKRVYLYQPNSNVTKLERLPVTSYKVDDKGYVTFQIIQGSAFVLLPNQVKKAFTTELLQQVAVAKKIIVSSAAGIESITTRTAKIKVTLPSVLKLVKEFTANAENKAVSEIRLKFKSNNKKVAAVSADGKLTGKTKGKTVITVTAELPDGKKKAFLVDAHVK